MAEQDEKQPGSRAQRIAAFVWRRGGDERAWELAPVCLYDGFHATEEELGLAAEIYEALKGELGNADLAEAHVGELIEVLEVAGAGSDLWIDMLRVPAGDADLVPPALRSWFCEFTGR